MIRGQQYCLNSSVSSRSLQLSNLTRDFGFIVNNAGFSGERPEWLDAADRVAPAIAPPPAPELSLQKSVSTQIAGPNTLVTYTVTITTIAALPPTTVHRRYPRAVGDQLPDTAT
jgi:hypothetical protein